MTNSISLWSLVSSSSWSVFVILLLLLMASVSSWVVILQKRRLIKQANMAMQQFENHFWSGMDLVTLYDKVCAKQHPDSGLEHIFKAGFAEFTRLYGHSNFDPNAVMVGTQRAMRIAVTREQSRLEIRLPILATVGSICPYLGLFGTVVGIMNAFRNLAMVQQPTLASVAPGIAEALLTTAVGLVAAIPAVVAYNRYATQIEALLTNYETFADEFASILHRKAHSQA